MVSGIILSKHKIRWSLFLGLSSGLISKALSSVIQTIGVISSKCSLFRLLYIFSSSVLSSHLYSFQEPTEEPEPYGEEIEPGAFVGNDYVKADYNGYDYLQ